MNLKSNVLIFSVFQKSASKHVNELVHMQMLSALKSENLPVIELQGKYKGSEELSILIQGFEYREYVERICKIFNQECYLESHSDRSTSLVFPDGSRKKLGTLVSVTKDEAESSRSFSYSPLSGYFAIRA